MSDHPNHLEPDFRKIFRSVPEPLLVLLPDERFTVVDATNAYLQAVSADRGAVVGRGFFEVLADSASGETGIDAKDFRASLQQVIATKEAHRMPVRRHGFHHRGVSAETSDEKYWEPCNIPVPGVDGELVYIIHMIEDVTDHVVSSQRLNEKLALRTEALLKELKQREITAANLAYYAKHDSLTGLPNRLRYHELLTEAAAVARRRPGRLAVMVVDLDNFGEINNALGHAAGDELVNEVAQRFRSALSESDVLARQGGDEFLILLDHLARPEDAADTAANLQARLRAPFHLRGREVVVTASIGIAILPDDGDDVAVVARKADAALRHAKRSGRGLFEFSSEDMQAHVIDRLELKAGISRALEHREFEVHYQPRIDLRTNRIRGAEALIRWRRRGQGYVSPDIFIAMAEEMGAINDVGHEVLRIICQDLAQWHAQAVPLPRISVNVSAHQFREQRLLRDVMACIDSHPYIAEILEFELTERVLMQDGQQYQEVFAELTRLGIKIAVDDFGTGCSGLEYFRRFPVHIIKIDRSFVAQAVTNHVDAMITKTIVDIANNFGLLVIAEGVETEDQRQLLLEQGCEEGQGFIFSQAIPAREFIELWQGSVKHP